MTALAKKLQDAGYDTFEAQFAVLAADALRAHPRSLESAWRFMGERFGFDYLRARQRDMQGNAAVAAPPASPPPSMPCARSAAPAAPTAPKPYKPRDTAAARDARDARLRILEKRLESKYCGFDARPYSKWSPQQLLAADRAAPEVAALVAALPGSVPNDGRDLGDVFGAKMIDRIVGNVRAKGQPA